MEQPPILTSRQARYKERQREKGFKVFEVELSPKDQERLSALCSRDGISQSEALRRALRECAEEE